jgi:hypothetical protein
MWQMCEIVGNFDITLRRVGYKRNDKHRINILHCIGNYGDIKWHGRFAGPCKRLTKHQRILDVDNTRDRGSMHYCIEKCYDVVNMTTLRLTECLFNDVFSNTVVMYLPVRWKNITNGGFVRV